MMTRFFGFASKLSSFKPLALTHSYHINLIGGGRQQLLITGSPILSSPLLSSPISPNVLRRSSGQERGHRENSPSFSNLLPSNLLSAMPPKGAEKGIQMNDYNVTGKFIRYCYIVSVVNAICWFLTLVCWGIVLYLQLK